MPWVRRPEFGCALKGRRSPSPVRCDFLRGPTGSLVPFQGALVGASVTQGIGLAASALGYVRSARWAGKRGTAAWGRIHWPS